MLAFYIAAATGLAVLAVMGAAYLWDRHDSNSLHRLHKRERKRMTIIHERGHDAQIVGDGAWR